MSFNRNGYVGIGSSAGASGGLLGGDPGVDEGDANEQDGYMAFVRDLLDRDWGVVGRGLSEPGLLALVMLLALLVAVPGQMWMHYFLLHPRSLSDLQVAFVKGFGFVHRPPESRTLYPWTLNDSGVCSAWRFQGFCCSRWRR